MNALPHGVTSYLESAKVSLSVALAGARDAELVHVNDRFTSLTGYDVHDVVGHNCRFLQGHLKHQPAVARLREFMADPARPRVRVQVINFRADGSPFVNQLTLTRIAGPGGATRLILASQFDISAAVPSELLDYNDEFVDTVMLRKPARHEREILLGSVQSMGDAAAAIAQARYLMDEADRAGLLGL